MSLRMKSPILIQGAHFPELEWIVESLSDATKVVVSGFTFWTGNMQANNQKEIPLVVNQSGIEFANAAASLAIAISTFHPIAVINQGIAGGHTAEVQLGDIIVGEYCVNLNTFKTPYRAAGHGSNSLEWKPKKCRGHGGGHEPISNDETSYIEGRKLIADCILLQACKEVSARNDRNQRVYFGGVGSCETWNSEVDRINMLHYTFGTLCEEMEAAASAQITQLLHVPFISIRIISNNILNDIEYELSVAEQCQRFVLRVIEVYAKRFE